MTWWTLPTDDNSTIHKMKTFFKIEWSFCDGDMCVYIYEICVFYLNFPSILVFRTTTDMARSKTLE